MSEQPSVVEIFEHVPKAINLTGFPSSEVLKNMQRFLGREVLLGSQNRRNPYEKRLVEPSFPLKYIKQRQDFFQGIGSGRRIQKTFFDRELPGSYGLYESYDGFLELCNQTYEIITRARSQLRHFKHMPETQRILSRIDGFDSQLESMLRKLKSIDNIRTFAIDTQKGLITMLSEMPKGEIEFKSEEKKSEWRDELFDEVRVKMKKQAIRIAKGLGLDFRKKMMDYVKREFRFRSGEENLRSDFERLAFPVRLHAFYNKFLEECEDYPSRLGYEDEDFEDFHKMPDLFSPKFGRSYDIRGLFPPKLMKKYLLDRFVPIDFKSTSSEKKFLIAGLHSGGKSFFLENIVLSSIFGQVGFDIPAEYITLPKYERIYYYRNIENHTREGKLETELNAINEIIREAGPRDLVVIDEFLDATSADIANSLGSEILDRLMKLKSTVFLTSHRNTDYKRLSKNGWIIMSPDYIIEGDRVKPTLTLSRGPPDEEINKRYVRERYSEIFID